jgi:hypothetical protein
VNIRTWLSDWLIAGRKVDPQSDSTRISWDLKASTCKAHMSIAILTVNIIISTLQMRKWRPQMAEQKCDYKFIISHNELDYAVVNQK